MLRQDIDRCAPDQWISGTHPRTFWRIAYHAVFYTHLYLHQDEASFTAWEKHRPGASDLWGKPELVPAYSKEETLVYLDSVIASVDTLIDRLDLDASSTGFSWYKNMGKLEHQFLNLRHLQGHVGQLSERLMASGIETDWMS